jgi:hypothetical protein
MAADLGEGTAPAEHVFAPFSARVKFTDGGKDLTYGADSAGALLVEAITQALESGRPPKVIYWDEGDRRLAYDFRTRQTMERREYVLRERKTKPMRVYGARVLFTDHGDALMHNGEEPDKVRIEALQKAKLTGREPTVVFWDTDDGTQAMTWPEGECMSREDYEAKHGITGEHL